MPIAKQIVRIALIVVIAPCAAWSAAPPPLFGGNGIVATDHELASQAGIEIMRMGGNAVDAACAAMFALGVVNPAGSGLGGGGFMLIKIPSKSQPLALDFRETAPKLATRNKFTNLDAKTLRFSGLSVAIPGEVAGCAAAVKRFGELPLSRVLKPAIRLAQKGFPIGLHLARGLVKLIRRLDQRSMIARIFFPLGKAPSRGKLLRRPKLAKALRAISRQGAKVFYRGWIARDLVKTIRDNGGIITAGDLASYTPRWRKPIVAHYSDYTVFGMPLPSSGGLFFAQVFNIFKKDKIKSLGHNSSDYLHLLTEAMKHSFADRARFLGDTDFVKSPVSMLLSSQYGALLRRRIQRRPLPVNRYGHRSQPKRPSNDSGTSHISVADKDGYVVALTSSINLPYGARFAASESGILLNNTMDDFATHPGEKNAFGLIQSEKNAVAPGKRPLSSMTPIIVTKATKWTMAAGGSGGPTIISNTLQAVLNVIVFALDASEAVSRSRIHHQWLPNVLWVEDDLPKDVVQALKQRGHQIKRRTRPAYPAVQVAIYSPQQLSAASDPRKSGYPAAY